MTLKTPLAGAVAVIALTAGAASAEPGLIIDLGGKFDKSFNESAYTGAQKWSTETGGKYRESELQSEAQREQLMRKMAESGANPVVVLGFANASTLEVVAPDYSETQFTIVDMVVDQPNVKSIVFTEDQGSYLVGLMAGMASKTNVVGFIGGMDIPLIRRFGCGYAQGVKAAKPDATVILNMTGTTPAAWNDPVKGAELAKAQKAQGADVIYAAAGGTGCLLRATQPAEAGGAARDGGRRGVPAGVARPDPHHRPARPGGFGRARGLPPVNLRRPRAASG